MFNPQVKKYIDDARFQNISDEEIKLNLLNKRNNYGMWVAFQYVLLFITLYVSATSLGGILYQMIDKYLPNPLEKSNYSYIFKSSFKDQLLRTYISGVIVSFPIFAFLYLKLTKLVKEIPEIKLLRLRKVLIYLTMVITFIILLTHLISTISGFLNGSPLARSLAFLAVTVVIAGSIFLQLILDVAEDRKV